MKRKTYWVVSCNDKLLCSSAVYKTKKNAKASIKKCPYVCAGCKKLAKIHKITRSEKR